MRKYEKIKFINEFIKKHYEEEETKPSIRFEEDWTKTLILEKEEKEVQIEYVIRDIRKYGAEYIENENIKDLIFGFDKALHNFLNKKVESLEEILNDDNFKFLILCGHEDNDLRELQKRTEKIIEKTYKKIKREGVESEQ